MNRRGFLAACIGAVGAMLAPAAKILELDVPLRPVIQSWQVTMDFIMNGDHLTFEGYHVVELPFEQWSEVPVVVYEYRVDA